MTTVKIAMVRDEPDARTFKIRSALQDLGRDVYEFVRLPPYHEFYKTYASPDFSRSYRFFYDGSRYESLLRHFQLPNTFSYWQLARRLRSKGFRIFHANSITEHLAAGLIRSGLAPVITEVYDSTSLYEVHNIRESILRGRAATGLLQRLVEIATENALRWEQLTHEQGSGLVYTSDEMLAYAKSRYQVRCPCVVVPNAVYGRLLPSDSPPEKLSEREGGLHVVYVGWIRDSQEGNHRDICSQLNLVASGDVTVHIYPLVLPQESGRVHKKLDDNPNVRWHPIVPYSILYSELRLYDAGLVLLAPHDEQLLSVALPNKIFEYVAAGLPVLVSPYKPLISFVNRFDCGTILDEPVTSGISVGRRRVRFRPEFTIEYYIPELVRLYERVSSS